MEKQSGINKMEVDNMIIDWKGILTKFKWPIIGLVILVIVLIAYGCHKDKTQPVVVPMSQQQAETPAGIDLAAKEARINLLQSQLNEASKQIAELKNKEPDVIIKTKPEYVMVEVEKGVKQSGADFAILTDPANADKPVNINDLPPNADVTLNQWNIHAYRPVLRQIEVAPDWAQLAQGKFKIDSAGYGVAKKISKSGKYLGIKAQYDFDDKEGKLLTTYTY